MTVTYFDLLYHNLFTCNIFYSCEIFSNYMRSSIYENIAAIPHNFSLRMTIEN